LDIKKETGVAVARQIDFSLDVYLENYARDPDTWRRDLLAYVKGTSGERTSKR